MGHIEHHFQSGILLFFSIQKVGEWQLLIDLRNINSTIVPMNALQPGLPTLMASPKKWPVVVIDLKGCFYNISIYPENHQLFIFSILSLTTHPP